MDKKTMESLRAMLCKEIEEISQKGNLGTHETLDILKDLIETEKNLGKIEHYDSEKEQREGLVPVGGYSQRKYYIDADYQPMGMNSYMNSRGMGGGSYGMGGRMVYDVDSGNSYMYTQMGNKGYARDGSKAGMIGELQEMMGETQDPKIKEVIQKAITEMNK